MNQTSRRAMRAASISIAIAAMITLVACDRAAVDAGDAPDAAAGEEINLMQRAAPGGVVAYVDGEPITFDQVLREAQAELNQLELQRFRTLEATVDRILARRLVARAAATEGIDPDTWLEREIGQRVPPPPEETIAQMMEQYKAHPAMSSRSPEAQRELVISQLTRDDVRKAHQALFAELRDRADIESFLEPPRIDVVVGDDELARGPANAPVTVVGYSDFQCEFCRTSNDAVERLLAEYGDRVRFVHRDFAIAEHPRATPAARAARCAGEQSRYWDYSQLLWTRPGNLLDQELVSRAESLALDMAAFRECFESDRYRTEVAASFEQGRKLGVTGTPTYFVNGLVLPGAQTYEALKMVIEDELREAGV